MRIAVGVPRILMRISAGHQDRAFGAGLIDADRHGQAIFVDVGLESDTGVMARVMLEHRVQADHLQIRIPRNSRCAFSGLRRAIRDTAEAPGIP